MQDGERKVGGVERKMKYIGNRGKMEDEKKGMEDERWRKTMEPTRIYA